ncbi:MAG: cell wall-active antibiotics response protein LiaF [bacterium]
MPQNPDEQNQTSAATPPPPAATEPGARSPSLARGRKFWGLILVALGALLLLDQMNLLDFGELLSRFWPLIFIFIGARMILSRTSRATQETTVIPTAATTWQSPAATGYVTDAITENRFIGDVNFRLQSEDFRGGTVTTFIGDFNIDLSNVAIKNGDRYLTLSGFIGDVMLVLPKNLPYMIQANAFVGDFKVFGRKDDGLGLNKVYKSMDYDTAAARLNVRISFFIGDLAVQ